MKKAFIYPYAELSSTVTNPYISDFITSLSDSVTFINNKTSKAGILNIYGYLGKIDMAFFNWIEELPDKKGGFIQIVLFVISIYLIKLKKIKIFYTLHNKESHYNSHKQVKKFLRNLMLKKADFILSHSSEGLDILKKESGRKSETLYLPHPFKNSMPILPAGEKKYDILIWGAIRPYKGIDTYLKFLNSRNLLNKYRTLIIGKIYPEEYEIELNQYKSDSIKIVNKFIDDNELNEIINESKIILFTYKENSVLSSGALIHSLGLKANILGPNTGAFKDIYQEQLIDVFNDYDELIEKIDYRLSSVTDRNEIISRYLEENSWEMFGARIGNWIRDKSH